MADEKRPGIGAYPLTVVAYDSAGNERYRTQLDWAGSERNLDDVPSPDLGERPPNWATVKIFDQAGKVVEERTNDANDDSSDDSSDEPDAKDKRADADKAGEQDARKQNENKTESKAAKDVAAKK